MIIRHTPSVKTPKVGDRVITGKTLKSVKVTIKINNKLYNIKSTSKGKYRLTTAKLKKGENVEIWAVDKKSATSKIKNVIVN